MAAHHTISTTNSLGTYDSLFDDDEVEDDTLGGICFDFDAPHAIPSEPRSCHAPSSWCKQSSSASCCSLCRLPAVSEAEDESNIGLTTHASSSLVTASLPRRSPGKLFLGGPLPIKSISIPRCCMDLMPAGDPKVDCLSASSLPDDALSHIVRYLDVPSLLRLRECNARLRDAASANTAGWAERCTALWAKKVHVCSEARLMMSDSTKTCVQDMPSASAMEAYKLSVTDAAGRKEIDMEEICFDVSQDEKRAGTIWSFRFKESAGRDWTSWDPWWNSCEARKLVFLQDGTIQQVHPKGLESTSQVVRGTRLYDVFSERTVLRDGVEVPAPRIDMRWRFVNCPLDLPERPAGAYVRITVGGRDVPTYVVRRSPNGNWGFVLESCWGVYASYELAPRVRHTLSLGRTRRRLRRTTDGGRWVNVEDSDGEGDGEYERERMRNVRRRIDLFVEESAMTQDGYTQWREALLYNIGAVTLPEGNGTGTEEFDTAWQNAMMMR